MASRSRTSWAGGEDTDVGDPVNAASLNARHDGGEGKDHWFCYVLECADGTFYTGITNSIDRRLSMHNRGRASRYTRGRLPVRLVYAEPYRDRSSASRREIEVKKMSRARKRRLGGVQHPAVAPGVQVGRAYTVHRRHQCETRCKKSPRLSRSITK